MLWSIDSWQNRISTDQYHLTVLRAQVSTHRGWVLFLSYPLTNHQFQMIVGSSLFFPKIHMKYVVFMPLWPRTVKILISNWPWTQKISQLFKTTGGEDLFFHGYVLVMLYVQFFYSDWSKFDRWVHMKNLCSILKVVLLWQLKLTDFCVNLWCFYWMYKMKYSYYQGSSVFHGWFVYCVFGWEMRRLSKLGNPTSDGIVFVFTLLDA